MQSAVWDPAAAPASPTLRPAATATPANASTAGGSAACLSAGASNPYASGATPAGALLSHRSPSPSPAAHRSCPRSTRRGVSVTSPCRAERVLPIRTANARAGRPATGCYRILRGCATSAATACAHVCARPHAHTYAPGELASDESLRKRAAQRLKIFFVVRTVISECLVRSRRNSTLPLTRDKNCNH